MAFAEGATRGSSYPRRTRKPQSRNQHQLCGTARASQQMSQEGNLSGTSSSGHPIPAWIHKVDSGDAGNVEKPVSTRAAAVPPHLRKKLSTQLSQKDSNATEQSSDPLGTEHCGNVAPETDVEKVPDNKSPKTNHDYNPEKTPLNKELHPVQSMNGGSKSQLLSQTLSIDHYESNPFTLPTNGNDQSDQAPGASGLSIEDLMDLHPQSSEKLNEAVNIEQSGRNLEPAECMDAEEALRIGPDGQERECDEEEQLEPATTTKLVGRSMSIEQLKALNTSPFQGVSARLALAQSVILGSGFESLPLRDDTSMFWTVFLSFTRLS